MPKRLCVTLLLIIGLLSSGCIPLFFAAGAGTGYLVSQKGSMKKVDRFFKNFGRSIRQTTRKIYGEKRTGQQIAYNSKKGLVLSIRKSQITPTRVNKGERVTLTLRYVLMGAPASGLQLMEKSRLMHGGKEESVLKTDSTTRENGTWENTLTFVVPDSAKPGRYTVVQELSVQKVRRSTSRSFRVL